MSGSWAVITGASSGLGVEYAERLAREGANVLLVARRQGHLDEVAGRVRARYGVLAETFPVDLTDPAGRAALIARLAALDVSHLVNNAGFGTMGRFHETDPGRMGQEMELNTVALTELTRAVVPGMVARGSGAVVQVASTAAFQPIPTMAVYAATKAYVMRLGIALWEELHETGVRVVVICPGPTETEFFATAGNDSVMRLRRTPPQVVDTTMRALQAHRPIVVDGWANAAMAFATRFAPVRLQARLARRVATI